VKPPIEMPTNGIAQQLFDLQRNDFAAPEASGRIGGVQAGLPLWIAEYTVGRVGAAKSDQLRAFMLSLRGATRRFLARDQSRPFPKAHIHGFAGMVRAGGSTPFTGDCTAWAETIDGDDDSQLQLSGLPAGLTLSVCDMVGFRWTTTDPSLAGLTWHAPVQVVVGGTANSSGVVTVTVEPPVPLGVPNSAIAYLNGPAAVMTLVTDRSKLEAIDRRLAVRGGAIVGIQDIRE
jgi:hypothetical protein